MSLLDWRTVKRLSLRILKTFNEPTLKIVPANLTYNPCVCTMWQQYLENDQHRVSFLPRDTSLQREYNNICGLWEFQDTPVFYHSLLFTIVLSQTPSWPINCEVTPWVLMHCVLGSVVKSSFHVFSHAITSLITAAYGYVTHGCASCGSNGFTSVFMYSVLTL